MMAIVFVFASCSKDQESLEISPNNADTTSSHHSLTKAGTQSYYGIEILGDQPFEEPTHGLPNLTRFKFWAGNRPDASKIWVEFQAPQDGIWYGTKGEFPMKKKTGTQNWFIEKTLQQRGRYYVRYRIFKVGSSESEVVTPNPNYVDISYVNAHIENNRDNCWINIYWPFADGSSYDNNVTYRNDVPYKWLDGNQDGKYSGGNGWNYDTHVDDPSRGFREKYALDYNLYHLDGTA